MWKTRQWNLEKYISCVLFGIYIKCTVPACHLQNRPIHRQQHLDHHGHNPTPHGDAEDADVDDVNDGVDDDDVDDDDVALIDEDVDDDDFVCVVVLDNGDMIGYQLFEKSHYSS